MSESYKRRIDDVARLGENPDGFESEGRNDQIGVQNGRSFDQILHEFRAELLKLTPEQSYLTKIEFVEQLIAERDMRPKYLDLEFGEPAWDMLIDLLRAAEQRQKISVSSLTQASRVPATTALRQLASLKSRNFIETVPDPFDKRRLYVRLTANARASLDEYLADLAFRRRIVLLPSALIGRAAE